MVTAIIVSSLCQFQSHNGAIAATARLKSFCANRSFQSHNGAIAAARVLSVDLVIAAFQSHNGAIAADNQFLIGRYRERLSIPQWCDCCEKYQVRFDWLLTTFNPTMVRLLLYT